MNVVVAKHWEFMVRSFFFFFFNSLIGRGSALKRGSMGQVWLGRQIADVSIGLCESGTPLDQKKKRKKKLHTVDRSLVSLSTGKAHFLRREHFTFATKSQRLQTD